MKTRRLLVAASAWLGVLASAGCAGRPPHRYFQPTAAQVGPELNSYGEAVVPRHGLIVVQGDDLAYGLARGRSRHVINDAPAGQAGITISQALRKVVKGVKVDNRGYPGDTVAQSKARWAGSPLPNLLILAYGFGDVRAGTPIQAFSDTLGAMVQAAQAQGTAVFLIVPPAVTDPLMQSELEPYRTVERGVASVTGATVFDTSAAMVRIKLPFAKGAAQTAAVYQAIAADMIPYIKVAPAPQTGQAGSGDSRTVRDSAASAS